MYSNEIHSDKFADRSACKMSSSVTEKLQTTDTPSASQCIEPQSTEIAKEDVPTRGTSSLSSGIKSQFAIPQTAVAVEEPIMDTPSRSHKELEPQPKVPRRAGDEGDLSCKIREARQRVQEKKEVLRKLNMAKTYRTKWETQDLGALTDRWLEVCQIALEDLRGKLKEGFAGDVGQQELTLKALMDNLGIDPELLHLNEEEDCFFT